MSLHWDESFYIQYSGGWLNLRLSDAQKISLANKIKMSGFPPNFSPYLYLLKEIKRSIGYTTHPCDCYWILTKAVIFSWQKKENLTWNKIMIFYSCSEEFITVKFKNHKYLCTHLRAFLDFCRSWVGWSEQTLPTHE